LIILGLDVSTSTTGWCITSSDGNTKAKFIDGGFIKHKSKLSLHEKASDITGLFDNIANQKITLDKICIEENLQSFRTGLSSARTLMTLSRYNGIVSHECWLATRIVPVYYNVNKARKALGIDTRKKVRKPGENAKDIVHAWVKNHETMIGFSWPTKTLKGGPRSGMTIEDPCCKDLSDAFVMSLCGHIEHLDF